MEKYLATLALVENSLGQSGENSVMLGVISGVDQPTGAVRVSFGDLSLSSCSPDIVRVLKDRNILYQELLTAAGAMEMETFKVLLRVNMLQDRGGSTAILEAMQLLRKNPQALQFATMSLSSQLGLSKIRGGEDRERGR